MEQHPLLKELLQTCEEKRVDKYLAYLTFDSYFELCKEQKLFDIQYFFNDTLNKFYLKAKTRKEDESEVIYLPVMMQESISPEELENFYETLCPDIKQFCLLIRDRDSSTTCYQLTKGLVKPDSPLETKQKKELDCAKYEFEKLINANRKQLYMKALNTKPSG